MSDETLSDRVKLAQQRQREALASLSQSAPATVSVVGIGHDVVDERPVDDDVVDTRQVLSVAQLRELREGFLNVLSTTPVVDGNVGRQASVLTAWIAPRLAGLEYLLRDERLRVRQVGAALAGVLAERQRLVYLAHRRHEVAVRLREELAAALAEVDRFRDLREQSCPRGLHDGWFVASEHPYACPWCGILEARGDMPPELVLSGPAWPPAEVPDDAPAAVLCDLLLLVGVTATEEQVSGWTLEQRREAERWAVAVHLSASDNPVEVPERPAFLGGGA